jgi:hypothetical protein
MASRNGSLDPGRDVGRPDDVRAHRRHASLEDSGRPITAALNPHLTKNRLNDAPRLCEMLHRNFSGDGIERNKVELVWAQAE